MVDAAAAEGALEEEEDAEEEETDAEDFSMALDEDNNVKEWGFSVGGARLSD